MDPRNETRLPEMLQGMISINKRAAIAAACECARWCLVTYANDMRALQTLAKTEAWTRGESVSLGPFFPETLVSEGTKSQIAAFHAAQSAYAVAQAADESDAVAAGHNIFAAGVAALNAAYIASDRSREARAEASEKMRQLALAKFQSLI